ncbi:MAG: transposase [Halioglobus sp.]|nr:transposase [Halioglobus sp.]
MRTKRYPIEQILTAVQQHESSLSVGDISRRLGIAEQTFSSGRRNMVAWGAARHQARPAVTVASSSVVSSTCGRIIIRSSSRCFGQANQQIMPSSNRSMVRSGMNA